MEDVNKDKKYTTFIPRFLLGWYYKETPENWLKLTPVKVFGIFIGYKMLCAKKGYQYSDGKVYTPTK